MLSDLILAFGALDKLPWLLAYLAAYSLGDFLLAQKTTFEHLR